jgi:hypothetical protein
MKQVVGCAVFVGLLAGAGIIFLKHAQLSGSEPTIFKEDTRLGASQRFVRAMAEGDLATMQRFANDNIKNQCQDLIDRFAERFSGRVETLPANRPDGEDPDRVMVRVNGRVVVDCWVRKAGGRYLVRECRF